MKIAVIGATGKTGRLITQEALARGHQVTAIVRKQKSDVINKLDGQVTWLVKDLFDLTYADLKQHDVIIDAFAVWTPETLIQHQTSLKHLADLLSGKQNRLIVVGGAGSLYVNPEYTVQLIDTPDFPDAYKPLATNMVKAFTALKTRQDVQWTYLSPAANLIAEGPRTGQYRSGGEQVMFNSKGESQISYADYAIAVIDEAEQAKHIKARFTVVSE